MSTALTKIAMTATAPTTNPAASRGVHLNTAKGKAPAPLLYRSPVPAHGCYDCGRLARCDDLRIVRGSPPRWCTSDQVQFLLSPFHSRYKI